MIILPDDPIARAIIQAAQLDIPILENPKGSNRSPEIDAMCEEWGVPLGSAWCALWTATCWKKAGAEVPPRRGDWHPAKADTWRLWALQTGRFSPTPVLGAAVLYGNNGHEPAHHIGCCVVSIAPILMDLEGNTSETGFSREGELTELKRVNTDRLIGYIHPHPIEWSV
jgi:hypothetical protein